MALLIPSEAELGLAAPTLGPWFSDAALTLQAPADDLSVPLALSSFPVQWRPPANGTLGLHVASTPRPDALAGLRDANGAFAFRDGSLVALFRLLPEAEERLDALLSEFLVSASGQLPVAAVQSRARVRHLALDIAGGAVLNPTIWDVQPSFTLIDPAPGQQAEHLGLILEAGNLKNAPRPMNDLKRPGVFEGGSQFLLQLGSGATSVVLWAFDDRGRAVDPGAVAEWWRLLAVDQFENVHLWAGGLEPPDLRTVAVAPARSLHLVDPHEGSLPAGAGAPLSRLTATNAGGGSAVRRQTSNDAVQLSFSPAAAGELPPLVALLPSGTYAGQLALWPPNAAGLPVRDFVRVALVDLDAHLLGARPEPGSVEARARVRPRVLRDAGAVLLGTTDEAARSAVQTLTGGGERRLAASVLDRDWGGLDARAFPAVPSGAFPAEIAAPQVRGLVGGGEPEGTTVNRQKVVLDFSLDPLFAGAWVRAWPQGFDEDKARHFRLDGGAAPVRATGEVTLVVELNAGSIDTSAPMAVDLILVTANEIRLYTEIRFDRPAPVAGAPVALGAATGPFLVCETGLVAASEAALRNPGQVPPGATVLSLQSPPALVDPASLTAAHFTDAALASRLPGTVVELTVPAFRRSDRGMSPDAFTAEGATVHQSPRSGFERATLAGAPLPTQERLEVAAARVDGAIALATLASTPALGRFHELLPHQAAHPGAPGAPELHGAGAELAGLAALPVMEHLRDRTTQSTVDLALASLAGLPAIPEPTPPTRWTALLRTVAAGTEGEPFLSELAEQTPGFPFGESLSGLLASLATRLPGGLPAALTGPVANAEVVARALDRRVATAARGARDAAVSLRDAFSRAQDFVYIETPAFDRRPMRADPAGQALWQVLLDSLDARPALTVLVCLPIRLLPGYPKRLESVRNELLESHPRLLLFHPSAGPGRSLRLASTTVVVDDAYALTGTTHLWRRGLSFDSSLSVAVFDEVLERGRPRVIRQFRRGLLAGRLGIPLEQVPDDPTELFRLLQRLRRFGGGGRLSTEPLDAPTVDSTTLDFDAWDPDGSPGASFNVAQYLTQLLAVIQSQVGAFEEDVT